MNILLIQREGTDLHHTLFASETSRLALRFYHPKKLPCGVKISVASLGSALSLVSEMRWYLRRYVRETLFEVEHGIYCTQAIAQDIYYERTPIPGKPWAYRRLYGFSHGKLARQIVISPGSTVQDYPQEIAGSDTSLEVWCTEDEVDDIGEPIPLDDTGEMPGARDNPEL
ncbi:MAG: DUF5804 family protein [Methanoregula sp.]|uniref:DUF5804 family protein n=1 Tax=Methanoregula sp. TaxID=2052170 RepID=UPI003BB1EDD9